MEFPYISLDIVVDEAIGECKKFYQQGELSKDDAYNYAIEASKLTAGNNYEEDTCVVTIKNGAGLLPPGFYICEEVWQVEQVDRSADILDPFHFQDKCYVRKQLMWPGDSSTVRQLKDKARTPSRNIHDLTYVFKRQLMRVSFKTGYVGMKYWHLPLDEFGVIMTQDEPNNIKGIKSYIKQMMLEPGFMAGQVAQYIYNSIKSDADEFRDQAQAIQKFGSIAATNKQIIDNQNRYNNFRIS